MRRDHRTWRLVIAVWLVLVAGGWLTTHGEDRPAVTADGRYADIEGSELHGFLQDIAAISRRSQRDGDVLWGRMCGSSYDTMTADFMKRHFEEFGLDEVWQERFPTLHPQPVATEVRLTLVGGSSPAAPQADTVFGTAMHTWPWVPTAEGGLEAAIVDVGAATPEELARVDLEGKIALVDCSSPWAVGQFRRSDPVGKVLRDGRAVGVVCALHRAAPSNMQAAINNADWRGRPGEERLEPLPQINLGSGDARYLARIIAESPADSPPRARMVIRGGSLEGTTQNTYGLIRGTTDEYVVLTAHTDGWFEAALDNGSGLAVMLGLAKHFAARPRDGLRRNLLFVATAGHHHGPAVGTWTIVKNHLEILRRTALAINLEHLAGVEPMPGTGPDFAYWQKPHLIRDSHWHPFLHKFLRDEGKRLGVPIEPERILYQYYADLYPLGAVGPTGVPSLHLIQQTYWYHTSEDTPDKVPPHNLQQAARLHAHLLDTIDGMSVAEIREGWKGGETQTLPKGLNVLDLDLDALRGAEILE
jgi:hypothetical protein